MSVLSTNDVCNFRRSERGAIHLSSDAMRWPRRTPRTLGTGYAAIDHCPFVSFAVKRARAAAAPLSAPLRATMALSPRVVGKHASLAALRDSRRGKRDDSRSAREACIIASQAIAARQIEPRASGCPFFRATFSRVRASSFTPLYPAAASRNGLWLRTGRGGRLSGRTDVKRRSPSERCAYPPPLLAAVVGAADGL